MASLEKYCEIKKLTEASIKYIASAGTSELANRRLLHMMTCAIHPKQDDSLFLFCNHLEVVIGSSDVGNIVEQLRNGTFFDVGSLSLLWKKFCVISHQYCRFSGGHS